MPMTARQMRLSRLRTWNIAPLHGRAEEMGGVIEPGWSVRSLSAADMLLPCRISKQRSGVTTAESTLEPSMRTNLAIAALIYPMIQAMFFGLGLLALLAVGAPSNVFPGMIAVTFVLSAPVALVIAPRL